MNESNTVAAATPAAKLAQAEKGTGSLPPKLMLGLAGLILCFSVPLYKWAHFAFTNDLYSYTLLVPAITVYLLGSDRKKSPPPASPSNRTLAISLIGSGMLVLFSYWCLVLANGQLLPQNSVALTTFSFVLIISGACYGWMRTDGLQTPLFPLGFLVFMIPFPLQVEHAIETFLQHGSVPPASWLFQAFGTPLFRDALEFQLPGIKLQVAPECSGIRSTIVLFITSVLAGHLFLRSKWKRLLLSVIVVPLALVRNGFRIFVIGQLCVSIGPHMIDSFFHTKGGPLFFALSLIPFAVLLILLVKSERPRYKADRIGS